MLGQQYLQGRYLQEAIETLSEAVRLKPEDPMLRSLLTSAYQRDKQFDKGLNVAKESLKLFPSSAEVHYEVGELLAGLGRYQEAKPYYEDAIRIDPSFVEAYCSMGDSLVRNGEYQAAFEKFLAARSLDDRNLRAARGIGQSLNRLQRYSEAVAELEKAIRVLPADSQLFFELSQAYTRLGNQAKAKEAVDTFEQLRAKETKIKDAERTRRFTTDAENPEKK
jgi:tetratricopeptide (TPR) repeat protein